MREDQEKITVHLRSASQWVEAMEEMEEERDLEEEAKGDREDPEAVVEEATNHHPEAPDKPRETLTPEEKTCSKASRKCSEGTKWKGKKYAYT